MVNVWGGECLGGERLTIVEDYVDDDDYDDHDDDIDGDCSNGSLLCTASFSWYRIDGQSEVWKIVAKTMRKLRILSSAEKK